MERQGRLASNQKRQLRSTNDCEACDQPDVLPFASNRKEASYWSLQTFRQDKSFCSDRRFLTRFSSFYVFREHPDDFARRHEGFFL